MTHQAMKPAHDEPQAVFAVVLDLSQHQLAHVERVIARTLDECDRTDLQLLFIVAEPVGDVVDSRVTLVEAGGQFDAVERLSLALQLVTAPRALVASTSVELSAAVVDQVEKLLYGQDLVEVDVLTVPAGAPGIAPFRSSRTVVFGLRTLMYTELRGLDLRIRTARDGVADLARRVRAWAGTIGALSSPESIATEPLTIEHVASQGFDVTKARGVFVNLPRWKYRPFAALPTISVLRLGSRSPAPFDAIASQSLDGYEVIDLAIDTEDERRDFQNRLRELGSKLVAVVAPAAAVPPWRLLEQIQHLRSARTFCIGRAAFIGDDGIRLLSNGPAAQPLDNPSLTDLGTFMGRADVLLDVIGAGPGLPTTRAQSSKIVSCSRPDHMPPRTTPAMPTESSIVAPYLDVKGSEYKHAIIFDQFTVGKVDYIDAYSRVGATGLLLDDSGTPRREITAVLEPTQADVDALAVEGLMFNLVSMGEGIDSIGAVLQELLGKYADSPLDLVREGSPLGAFADSGSTRPAHLFVRDSLGREGWFRLDRELSPGGGGDLDEWRTNMVVLDRVRWEA